MTLIACASVSGAPGVTTAALGLAAYWPQDLTPVLAEADPSGGDLQVLFGLPESPGTVSLAAASRRASDPDLLWRHAQWLTPRLAVLPAPVGAEQARATGSLLAASSWAPVTAAARSEAMIVADCGRAGPGTPAAPLIQAADLLLIVTTTGAEALAHLDARLGALRRLNPRLRLLLSGPRGPYPQAEISGTLQAEVAGRLPHDPAGASRLRGHPVRRGPGTRWRAPENLPLLTAAAGTAARLARLVVPGEPAQDRDPVPARPPRHPAPRAGAPGQAAASPARASGPAGTGRTGADGQARGHR
jgi:hypothetical protein